MSKLLVVDNRACGERCYEALPSERCRCVCSGMNHGQGRRAAQRNVIELGEYLLDAVAERERRIAVGA